MDLTVIYYTANYGKEPFMSRVREQLSRAIGDIPLISVSQQPMDFGRNICVGNIGRTYLNIYHQILVGAEAAETDYVALAEDDALYPKEHFDYRPPADYFGYDMSKWSIYTWSNPPVFSLKKRRTNVNLIAPRKLLVEALTERFEKYPDPNTIPLEYWAEPGKYESLLGVTVRKVEEYRATVPIVVFSHPEAIGYDYLGTRKKLGDDVTDEIPYWGKAKDIIKYYDS